MMINNTFDTNAIHKTCSSGSKIIKPFGPPIYQTEVSQDIVNSLNEEGDKLNVEKNDFRRNLAGNMKTGNSFFYNKEYAKFISKKLTPYVNDYLDNIAEKYGQDYIEKFLTPNVLNSKTSGLTLESLWINYQKAGDFNPRHTHTGNISFVIFTKVPQRIFDKSYVISNTNHPGEIIFAFGESFPNSLHGSEFRVKPYERLMFIFPSYLQHSVNPFWTDDTRVSISGNYSMVWEQDK